MFENMRTFFLFEEAASLHKTNISLLEMEAESDPTGILFN